jgi:hypothetical protein
MAGRQWTIKGRFTRPEVSAATVETRVTCKKVELCRRQFLHHAAETSINMRHEIDKGLFANWDTDEIQKAFIKREHDAEFAYVGQQTTDRASADRTWLAWAGFEYLVNYGHPETGQ